ncbi:MAG TPA: copper transporter [Streptosporangiaceae bacterium]|nr:copper transporter [Streptosporangiaceae bacterium]
MIDFRYHLVSIVAVFLALAIGIVLGSTELQGPVYNILSHTTSSLQGQLANVSSQRAQLEQEANADDEFIQANETQLLAGKLTDQRIAIIAEPGAQPSVVSGIIAAARVAGATVTDQINLTNKFFDGSNTTADTLISMNSSLAQSAGIQLDSSSASPQAGAATVLASEILTKAVASGGTEQSDSTTTTSTDAQSALQSYAGAGFLQTNGGVSAQQATLAVIVTPQTIPADGSADNLAQYLGPFTQALAKVNNTPTVVVGSAAGSVAGSPIAVLRGTGVASQVSTVDDADTLRGQIVAMETLLVELSGGSAGSYGIDSGSPDPSITPSPSATASASSSPSTDPSKKPKK